MKKIFSDSTNFRIRIWKLALKMLGFAGVSMYISCKYGTPAPEYGIPANDILFRGKITSADSLKPISNIQIKITNIYGSPATATSDNLGNYSLVKYVNISDSMTFEVKDVDGNLNGSFKDTTVGKIISENDFNTGIHTEDIQLTRKP